MKKKILVIEDEIDIILIYQVALDNSEYEMHIAKDGQDGYDKALKLKPDLIILDLLMPKMDGFTFLEKLRANAEFKETPVIVASNLDQGKDIDRVKKMGIKEFLIKNRIAPDDIINKINNYLK